MTIGRIIVLSDLHIGVDAPTNWYQQRVHQPFLLAILEEVLRAPADVSELVIAGDLVDQWTYPPGTRPPTFAEIASHHPAIFGTGGALVRALTALDGRVTFLPGNHDMSLSESDVATIRDAAGRSPRLVREPFYHPAAGRGRVLCAHGHQFSVFNALDPEAPVPLGHFVTRLSAAWSAARLAPGSTVADLPGSGDPTGWPLDKDALIEILRGIESKQDSLAELVLTTLAKAASLPLTTAVRMLDGSEVTIAAAIARYAGVYSAWSDPKRFPTEWYGSDPGPNALLETDADDSLLHFASLLGARHDAVVLGHTHVGRDERAHPFLLGSAIYANAGFNCPSVPDLGRPSDPRLPTFVEIVLDDAAAKVTAHVHSASSSDAGVSVDAVPVRQCSTAWRVGPSKTG